MIENYAPQGYPLWAVRAASCETTTEIGVVIGWEGNDDGDGRRPIVAPLGPPVGAIRGSAFAWLDEVVPSPEPGMRWVERVEFYPTAEQAQERAPLLLEEVGKEHDRCWPEDAAGALTHDHRSQR